MLLVATSLLVYALFSVNFEFSVSDEEPFSVGMISSSDIRSKNPGRKKSYYCCSELGLDVNLGFTCIEFLKVLMAWF